MTKGEREVWDRTLNVSMRSTLPRIPDCRVRADGPLATAAGGQNVGRGMEGMVYFGSFRGGVGPG
jgi:hypothetical protein